MKKRILEKFLRYISIDTMADPESPTQPSTQKQLNLSKLLVKELKEMGVKNVLCYGFNPIKSTPRLEGS